MNLIRVFPRRTSLTPTDEYAFVGDPPMIRPETDEVHVSCAFTWDKSEAERLVRAWGQYYSIVKLGGPAYGSPVDSFTPGRYIRQGATFTSRGCNNLCPWCLVPQCEGRLLEYEHFFPGRIIQDNNLLQCSKQHVGRVFDMLRRQRAIQFTGGLDSRLMTDNIADQLRSLRIYQLFLAADTKESLRALRQAVRKLSGLSRDKLRCYVLLGFGGELLPDAKDRLTEVWETGCLPFAQLYQSPNGLIRYSQEWRDLARTWSRPAATKAYMGR